MRFDGDALDWYEEDGQIFVQPRDPHTRVDALRSSRHVRLELAEHPLAESRSPVMVFETGLPTRYYLDRCCLDPTVLRRTATRTPCPYKGETSNYWTAEEVPGRVEAEAAWKAAQHLASAHHRGGVRAAVGLGDSLRVGVCPGSS